MSSVAKIQESSSFYLDPAFDKLSLPQRGARSVNPLRDRPVVSL